MAVVVALVVGFLLGYLLNDSQWMLRRDIRSMRGLIEELIDVHREKR